MAKEPKLTEEEFYSLLAKKAGPEVAVVFRKFKEDLWARHSSSRMRFVLTSGSMIIKVKPPKQRRPGKRELVHLVVFGLQGKRKPRQKGVCHVMRHTEIDLRNYGYPPGISRTYYDKMRKIDARLDVGRRLAEQLPLRCLTRNKLDEMSIALSELTESLWSN